MNKAHSLSWVAIINALNEIDLEHIRYQIWYHIVHGQVAIARFHDALHNG